MKKITLNFNEQINLIENNTVYRLTAKTDKGGFFVSTNGMPQTHFTNKQILSLANIQKNKKV